MSIYYQNIVGRVTKPKAVSFSLSDVLFTVLEDPVFQKK